ncbi:MAG TPA: response regulator transcription factor [Pirellulales bacterium]|jgi:DNA-binding response OmpR family regulator|nr:response regulator transcription factor [Pirellulales bacterium]
MAAVKILTVEDDPAIRRGIVDALQFAGYTVMQAANGHEGLEKATHSSYDLLMLDLIMPGPSGLDILKAVRANKPTQPVIILTAKGEEDDRVQGLRLGADDYVVKPFSVKELLARVEAVLRRSPERPQDILQVTIPEGMADLARREVRFQDGQRTELSEREVELLRYLAANVGRALAREELLSHVWGLDPRGISTRTIDMHVARLREKLRDAGDEPRIILTVRGKGYMFANLPAAAAGVKT